MVNSDFLLDPEFQLDFEQQEDFLVEPGAGQYPKAIWFNGRNAIIDVRRKRVGDATGWLFDAAKTPGDFNVAIEKLIEAGTAQFVTVEHPDTVKDYYLIPQAHYILLAHGVAGYGAIPRDERLQVGVAAGVFTLFDRRNNETDTASFVGILAVIKELFDAGYMDENLLPKPVILRAKSYGGRELHEAITRHLDLVKYAREHRPENAPRFWGQYWSHSMTFDSAQKVMHGQKGGQQSEARRIASAHPFKDNLSDEYVASTYIGDELARHGIIPLVFDVNDMGKLTPGGMAVKWCREEVKRANDNQAELNPGGRLQFGKHPAPVWLIKKLSAETAPEEDATVATAPTSEREKMIESLRLQQQFFRASPAPEAKKWLTAINVMLEDLTKGRQVADGAIEETLRLVGNARAKITAATDDPYS